MFLGGYMEFVTSLKILKFLTLEQKKVLDEVTKIRHYKRPPSVLKEYREKAESHSKEIVKRAYSLPEFLRALEVRWQTHKMMAIRADKVLVKLVEMKRVGSKELRLLLILYERVLQVDFEKHIYQLALRSVINNSAENLRRRCAFTQKDFWLLMTPSRLSFWIQYRLDHLKYVINVQVGQVVYQDNTEDSIKKRYHLGDEDLFTIRFERNFNQLLNRPVEENRIEIETIESEASRVWAEKVYFMIERGEAREIDSALCFDNCIEPLFHLTLQSIPDYLLRRFVIRILVDCGKVNRGIDIFEYHVSEISEALKGLIQDRKSVEVNTLSV